MERNVFLSCFRLRNNHYYRPGSVLNHRFWCSHSSFTWFFDCRVPSRTTPRIQWAFSNRNDLLIPPFIVHCFLGVRFSLSPPTSGSRSQNRSPLERMDVVSLFDGVSCARVALDRAGIDVKSYTACEIDKYAIQISKKNHPAIQHKGDVKEFKTAIPCDLLIGGSPCVDLSIAKKDRKGLKGDHSSLFYEYVRILNLLKPKWFVLENVASMKASDRDTITATLGVEPVMIDAGLVSAQRRKRYFWTNLKVELPADRGIVLKDILQPDVAEKYFIQKTITEIEGAGQARRIYDTEGKGITLSATSGGWGAKTGLYKIGRIVGRRLVDGIRADADKSIDPKQVIELSPDQSKSGTLTKVQKDNVVVSDTRVRRLTPIECERLQSLPDEYTAGVSDTQRYKCCGNAFNVEVVAHILRNIPGASSFGKKLLSPE